MKFKVEISTADVADAVTHEQAIEVVEELKSAIASYEFDSALFRIAMGAMIETAKDRKADSSVKLEIDEMITGAIAEFRAALHGGGGRR